MIKGPRELHVHEGSKLRLHCLVEQATEPPIYVFWFHNSTMVNYEPKRPLKVVKHKYTSSLHITNVSKSDAGVYRCEPHLATPDNVTLHVISGNLVIWRLPSLSGLTSIIFNMVLTHLGSEVSICLIIC